MLVESEIGSYYKHLKQIRKERSEQKPDLERETTREQAHDVLLKSLFLELLRYLDTHPESNLAKLSQPQLQQVLPMFLTPNTVEMLRRGNPLYKAKFDALRVTRGDQI